MRRLLYYICIIYSFKLCVVLITFNVLYLLNCKAHSESLSTNDIFANGSSDDIDAALRRQI